MSTADRELLLERAREARQRLGDALHDRVTESLYSEARRIASRAVSVGGKPDLLSRRLDSLLTNRLTGFPVMFLLLVGVFWLTIAGSNFPSALLGTLTTDTLYGMLHAGADRIGAPWWLTGLLIDGVYLAMAWVFSVMLPPMAIFFPLFTLLEDFGYLPRVAFNLDRLFKSVGAHGKQSLTMMMGYGCNAAGIVSTRIIDSPRERLIAIITNNFSICNGRWPLLILMGTIFLGAAAPPALASLIAAGSVVGISLLGVVFAMGVSLFLSRTWLKGEASAFSLELPPYRPPRILQTLYTSLIDRTLIVLKRAMIMAAPAGAVIWLIGNVHVGSDSLAAHLVNLLDPLGLAIGLNGVILLAYVVAIPANEIVIPTIMMLTLTLAKSSLASAGVMTEFESVQTREILTEIGGWTVLTGLNLMLFSLLHNPCSTTLLTIWQETKSLKWTAVSALLPLALGFAVCFLSALVARAIWSL